MIYQVLNKNEEIISLLKKRYAIRVKELSPKETPYTFINLLMLYSNLQNGNVSYIINGSFLDKYIISDTCLEYIKKNKQFLNFIYNKQDITQFQKNFLEEYKLKSIEFDKENSECKFFMTFKNYTK